MIYKDLLEKYEPEIKAEFENIFHKCLKNQAHPCELLVWKENGFYDESLKDFKNLNGVKLSPYVIGPGRSGHSEMTHYDFINQYRQTNISDITYEEYVKKVAFDQSRKKEIEELEYFESTAIQIEMLIYLKIWEADLFIKKFYELARIINGEHYDWHFKVAESLRDKNATGTRQDIIRKKIRDAFKKEAPFLSDLITSIYKTQIRNSIAHSNYSIMGRTIDLNNYIKNDPASQLHGVSFDQWHEIFNKLILLHNYYLWLTNHCNDYYAYNALNGKMIEIMITKDSGEKRYSELEYRKEFNDWKFKHT